MSTKQEIKMHNEFNKYAAWVESYAEQEFNRAIRPWLEKYHLRFLSGNGGYWIGYTDKTPRWFVNKYRGYYKDSIDSDEIDSRIRDILNSEIDGMPGNSLGTIMPDYEP